MTNLICKSCTLTASIYPSDPPKIRCPITGNFHSLDYECDCIDEAFKIMTKHNTNYNSGSNENLGVSSGSVKKYEPDLTLDGFISILKREYDRGMYTAKQSKFDEGYAYAMKLCIMLARGIKK